MVGMSIIQSKMSSWLLSMHDNWKSETIRSLIIERLDEFAHTDFGRLEPVGFLDRLSATEG
jgi:putative component of toxin-antitoxin plasmid stabilization module